MSLMPTFALDGSVGICDIVGMNALHRYAAETAKTHAELAEEIGLSRSYVTEILSGTRRPGRKAIEKIADATNGAVPAQSWFDETETSAA
jgi:transcriptional regulator with XRE-family HTH domain